MSNLEIRQCIFTKNDCYKSGKKIKHSKIVVHSSGANNPNLKRYVQPDDGLLGDNPNNNDWNRSGVKKCVHAFIGKDKNGTVRVYQTLPWDYRCWGCGSGQKGSYNDSAIQFEILEDAMTDKNYFNKAFTAAIELCAYLCKTFNISVDQIVSHKEAHALGYASNHGDCDKWLSKFGKDMNWFRSEVKKLLNPPATSPGTTTTTNSTSSKYYPKYTGKSSGLDAILKAVGVPSKYTGSWQNRKALADANGIGNYTGTITQNSKLKKLAKEGKLVKVGTTSISNYTTCYPKYTGNSSSLDTILKAIGVPAKYTGSWKNRKPLAQANGISNYTGSILQNSNLKKLAKNGLLKRV